jgi:hypothetical protein
VRVRLLNNVVLFRYHRRRFISHRSCRDRVHRRPSPHTRSTRHESPSRAIRRPLQPQPHPSHRRKARRYRLQTRNLHRRRCCSRTEREGREEGRDRFCASGSVRGVASEESCQVWFAREEGTGDGRGGSGSEARGEEEDGTGDHAVSLPPQSPDFFTMRSRGSDAPIGG